MIWNITLKRLYDGYMAKGGEKVTWGIYGAHNIDKYGDQKGNTEKAKNKAIKNELNSLKANHYGKEFDKDAIGWKYLEEFVNWCDKKGVKTIFMPSTLLKFKSYKKDKTERWFYENLPKEVEKRGWEFVGEPFNYMYRKKYYFNTDFHLTTEGRKIRTNQMILDLKSSGIKFNTSN